MSNHDDIQYERKVLGSPAILWPLLTNHENWQLWLGQADPLAQDQPFNLEIKLPKSNHSLLWQGKVTQVKNQIFFAFTLTNQEIKQQTQVKFFIKQNNEDLILQLIHSGFSSEGLLQRFKIKKLIKQLDAFWLKALNKLDYQLEQRLK